MSTSKAESVKVVELKVSNGYVICPECSYVYKKGSECPVCKGDKNKPNASCPTCKGGYIVQTGTHSTHCNYCNKDFQCCPAGTLHCSACGLCGAPYGKGEGENYYLSTYGYCSSCTNAYVLPSTCQYCGNTLTSDYEKNLSMCNTCITMRTCRICGQIRNDVLRVTVQAVMLLYQTEQCQFVRNAVKLITVIISTEHTATAAAMNILVIVLNK